MTTCLLAVKPIKDRNEARRQFMTYINTVMFYNQRIRNQDGSEPVHIPMQEIRYRFFRRPWFRAKIEIQWLKEAGMLEVSERLTLAGNKINYYRALAQSDVDLSMLPNRSVKLGILEQHLRNYLMLVDLPPDAPSTPYFDAFLKWKHKRPDLFFLMDNFSGRIHTPVTNFHRTHRPHILLDGMPTTSLDVVTMQPLLLGKILREKIGPNEFSVWLDSGQDIYLMLQKNSGLNSRDEAKKRFFEILFSKPSVALSDLFGDSPWIRWINEYKSIPVAENPHTTEKYHSNLAWLLQSTEVRLMRRVWGELTSRDVPFLSVHDEIIVRTVDQVAVEDIFHKVLKSEFNYFRLEKKSNY